MNRLFLMFLVSVAAVVPRSAFSQKRGHNDWCWDSQVNLHIDNHSNQVGHGHTVAELTDMVRNVPVSMIQVAAFGNGCTHTTYPSEILPSSAPEGHDTPGVWKQVAANLDRRFCIYMNSLGLQVYKTHPEWMRRRANGQPYIQRVVGRRMCVKTCPDGQGYLEQRLLPLVREVVSRYRPDGVWMDGDWSINADVCWCDKCKKAWRLKTGKNPAPTTADDPDWPAWLRFHYDRCYEYRRIVADVVHEIDPNCVYTSNGGWRIRTTKDDPRSAPAYVGSLSHDLSRYEAMKYSRLYAMAISCEEETPHDIMHLINAGNEISVSRLRQEAGLTMASGSTWFMWTGGTSIVQPPVQERARVCARFVRDRGPALGRWPSRNPIAVLASETSWERRVMDAKADHFSSEAVDTVAMTLQDAHYGVDVVNEHILRSGATEYRVLVVPDTQREVAPETFVAIVDFVRDGGKLAVLGNSLLTVEGVADPIESLRRLHGDATCAGSVTIADVPSQLLYPKAGGVLVGVMDRLQVTPDVTITSGGEDRHLVFSQRGRDDRLLLHVVDLTSHADGRQLPPNDKNNATDPVEAIPTLRLKMRLATAPNDVAIWPTDSRVKHAWRDGVLELTLRNVETHAVVDISLPISEASP